MAATYRELQVAARNGRAVWPTRSANTGWIHKPPELNKRVLDEYLANFDRRTRHHTEIDASPAKVWPLVRRLDLSRSPIIRVLFAARGMGRPGGLADLDDMGFTVIQEDPPRELVLGLIGQFWKPSGRLRRVEADEFVSFSEPGYVKTIWGFSLTGVASGRTLLETETRILCTDDVSRRRFGRYWRFIRPFSGLVRRETLRLIRKQAEL